MYYTESVNYYLPSQHFSPTLLDSIHFSAFISQISVDKISRNSRLILLTLYYYFETLPHHQVKAIITVAGKFRHLGLKGRSK